MPTVKWNDGYYVRAYALAKSGLSDIKLAAALGITTVTLGKWRKNRPYFNEAIEEARAIGHEGTFQEYVYKQLPDHLQDTWDTINDMERQPNSTKRIEALLHDKGLKARQRLFMHALVHCSFNPSEACNKVNIAYKTMLGWVANDPDFAGLLDEINIHKKNFFEEALVRGVAAGEPAAYIFANKTYNREKYGDKITVEHTGTINHNHAVLDLTDLLSTLPIDARKTILAQINTPAITEEIKEVA